MIAENTGGIMIGERITAEETGIDGRQGVNAA
jgi:hypothetical protein